MFQATRQRLALWYTSVTAVLLLLFATGFYLYVRTTLVERIDDTLNHVVEIVQRSLVIESIEAIDSGEAHSSRINIEASFRDNADTVDDDHIDLEWFSPTGELLWSTFSQPLNIPLHISDGETVHLSAEQLIRQVTQRVEVGRQVMGYLRVSHPWFEVTKPTRQLIRDLSLGIAVLVSVVAAIGWFLSGLAIAPVRASYQQLKQFTADASHELRNPIAVIQTNVQVALADPDPQLQQQQLKVVERLTRRLGRLVDDLLFLARQDGGITPLKMAWVDLGELLMQVVEEQTAMAAEKQINLVFDVAPSAETATHYQLHGDPEQLTRLFTNLISNAVQYTPNGGCVTVSLLRCKSHVGHQLQIKVQDTGIGIPQDALSHVFDRFYRVDPARTHSHHTGSQKLGSGLGLAIAKVIADNHHGDIQVESQLQHGSTFTVVLPQHKPDGDNH